MGSGGGGGGGSSMPMPGVPMKGIPIAGEGGGMDPYDYGKFQNFLPDIKAEGQNDMATGLRPDMFQYKSPGGQVAPGAGDDIQSLRDQLAKLQAGQGQGPQMMWQPGMRGSGSATDGWQPSEQGSWVPMPNSNIMGGNNVGAGGTNVAGGAPGAPGGAGGVGTMGMGGGGGGGAGGQVRMPGGQMMGSMDPTGGQYSQAGVPGYDAFSSWLDTSKMGGQAARPGGGPIDWRVKDAGPLIAQPTVGM